MKKEIIFERLDNLLGSTAPSSLANTYFLTEIR